MSRTVPAVSLRSVLALLLKKCSILVWQYLPASPALLSVCDGDAVVLVVAAAAAEAALWASLASRVRLRLSCNCTSLGVLT